MSVAEPLPQSSARLIQSSLWIISCRNGFEDLAVNVNRVLWRYQGVSAAVMSQEAWTAVLADHTRNPHFRTPSEDPVYRAFDATPAEITMSISDIRIDMDSRTTRAPASEDNPLSYPGNNSRLSYSDVATATGLSRSDSRA